MERNALRNTQKKNKSNNWINKLLSRKMLTALLGIVVLIGGIIGYQVFGAHAAVQEVLNGDGDFEGSHYSAWTGVNVLNEVYSADNSIYNNVYGGNTAAKLAGSNASSSVNQGYYMHTFTTPNGLALSAAEIDLYYRYTHVNGFSLHSVTWSIWNATNTTSIVSGYCGPSGTSTDTPSFSRVTANIDYTKLTKNTQYILRIGSSTQTMAAGTDMTHFDDVKLNITYTVDTTKPVATMVTPSADPKAGNVTLQATASDNVGVTSASFEYSTTADFAVYTPITDATHLANMVSGTALNGTWQYIWDTKAAGLTGDIYVRARAKDAVENVADPSAGVKYPLDNVGPNVALEYFSDAGLNIPLPVSGGYPVTKVNTTVYVKLVPNEYLKDQTQTPPYSSPNQKLTIVSPPGNGVTNANFIWTSAGWVYTWNLGNGTDGLTSSMSVYATDALNNVVTNATPTSGGTVKFDVTPPSLATKFYSDANLTQELPMVGGRPLTTSGTVYVELIPSEPLRSRVGDDTITIDAPGTRNDISNGKFIYSRCGARDAWRYIWSVVGGSDGDVGITVKGTDSVGNAVTRTLAMGECPVIDTTPPVISINYFSDPAMTQQLEEYDGRPITDAGAVYVKVTSNEDLENSAGANKLTLDAPGTSNDVKDANLTVNAREATYIWNVVGGSDGTTNSVVAKVTDIAGNAAFTAFPAERMVIIDNTAPVIGLEYYGDSALTQLLPMVEGKYLMRAGQVYVKLVSDDPLSANNVHTLAITTPNGANNITNVNNVDNKFVWDDSLKVWKYSWTIVGNNDGLVTSINVNATNLVGLSTSGTPTTGGSVDIKTGITATYVSVTVAPRQVVADDITTSTITARVTSQYGLNLENQFVDFHTNLGTISPVRVQTNSEGLASVTIKSSEVGLATLKATVEGNGAISGASTVRFGPVDSAAPVLKKADPSSKQVVYLTFDEPIRDPNDPNLTLAERGSVTISGGTFGTDAVINQVYLTADPRVVRIILPSNQATGNQYTPLTYTVKVERIRDLFNNILVSGSQPFEAFTPHGKYAPPPDSEGKLVVGNSTPMCGQCHIAHNSVGKGLLNSTTIKNTCFVCHGVIGISDYRVESEFLGRGGTTFSASLHKSLDDIDYNFLSCIDCHNPHGDWNVDKTGIYPKLLRSADSTGKYYTGNQFCLGCHGKDDLKYEELYDAGNNLIRPSYYVTFGGNHISPLHPTLNNDLDSVGPVHYDVSAATGFPAALGPASQTNITCVKCHERHGSQYAGLLDNTSANREEDFCFKCHGKETTYYSRSNINIFELFSKTSRHEVASTAKGRIECTSCHGPHTVDNVAFPISSSSLNTSDLSNPFNTKEYFLSNNGANDLSKFCLKCHDSTFPTAVTNSTTLVPYSISFVDQGFSTNRGGWNKNLAEGSYLDSAHYKAGTPIQCTNCHDPHGSDYPWLVKDPEDTTGTAGACTRCHQSGGGAPNVRTAASRTFSHPTLKVSGKHSNTEDPQNIAPADRHAACYDCHDPHSAKKGTGQVDQLGDVSGVDFDWGSTTWQEWNNSTPTAIKVNMYQLESDKKAQANLCFKCHSKYAYTLNGNLRAPVKTPSGDFYQTDLAREFNPNNKSKHIVIPGYRDSSTDINIAGTYGSFTGSWASGALALTKNSVLKCTDCHGSATGAQGPHGSTNAFILVAPWVPDGSTKTGMGGTENHLCFKCHSYSTYASGGEGTSQFRSSSNLHTSHGASWGCSKCHGGLPHGWWRTNANGHGLPLTLRSDPAPYGTGSGIIELDTSKTEGGVNPWSGHGDTCKSTAR